ncbi:UNVERIFIED_CONTAM: hypothetical protein Sindi_1691700 [Sesamum indicum]
MEASEAKSIMLRLKHLRKNLEEFDRKFGQLEVNAQISEQIQRADLDNVQLKEHDPKYAIRVQDSRPVASDSSTDYTMPSRDSGEMATIESQEVQNLVGSSQPSTSGVKEGEISLKPMTDTSKANTNELISPSAWQEYQRSNSEDVREWHDFGALASVHTMPPSFSEISKLPEWISGKTTLT